MRAVPSREPSAKRPAAAYTGDDVIIDVAAGTYFENDSLSVSSLSSLTIAGAGASSTVVNGGSLSSVITINSGTVIISGLTVENGYVNSAGGGIHNFGTTTVTNSVITGNTATGNGANGAGLYNDGSLSVSDSTVSGNSGGAGAGIYNFSGQLSVSDSTISGNTTSLNGGGVSNASPGATATITDSTFSGNSAAVGGALYVTRDTVTLAASTIVGNSANAGDGGGIANFATLDMAGDIMADNGQGLDCGSIGSAVTDLGYNIDDNGSCGFSATGSISNSSSLDASLAPLANNGGPTQTILPTGGSPAAGAIPNPTTVDAIQLCPTTDQRGTASALNAACNMGAVQGVVGPPTITGFTPPSGSSGTVVTITGTNLLGATEVTFNGKAGTVTTVGQTEITVKVPPGATTGYVRVTTPSGSVTSASQFIYTGPTITGFTPSSGPPGTVVTITGTNLALPATEVSFNGKAATDITSDTPTKITVKVPAGATTGYINVTAPSGSVTSASKFTYTGPTITGFTPSSGPPGTVVTITGTNLSHTTAVSFNGIKSTITGDRSTQITVKVPAGATTGYIEVVTLDEAATSATKFTDAAPTITGFTPLFGLTGTVVTITGTNLSHATCGVHLLRAHPVKGTVTSDMSTQITVKVPTGATTGYINVTTSLGTVTSTSQFAVSSGPPTITGFTPSSGPPGTIVTITGTNLSGATEVSFNGEAATEIISDTPTEITVKVPAGATTGDIKVTTPSGSVTSASKFIYTGPTITGFTPSSGPPGTVVTITGTNLSHTTAVGFNGIASTITEDTSTKITVKVPTGATTGYIEFVTPDMAPRPAPPSSPMQDPRSPGSPPRLAYPAR